MNTIAKKGLEVLARGAEIAGATAMAVLGLYGGSAVAEYITSGGDQPRRKKATKKKATRKKATRKKATKKKAAKRRQGRR